MNKPIKDLPLKMFRELSPASEQQFRQWARDNYQPLSPIKGVWHPIVQEECAKMNKLVNVEEAIGPIMHDMVKDIFKS